MIAPDLNSLNRDAPRLVLHWIGGIVAAAVEGWAVDL
jgi:hypothetical protein